MDSTNFHQDPLHQQHYLQQQQESPYPYIATYSSLLDDHQHHHLAYGVSPIPENQGSYSHSACEVPSASSEVTNSEALTFSYHSLSSNNNNDDIMGSPNFLSNFLGIFNQNPNDGNQLANHHQPWIPQTRSINNSLSSLLASNGGGGGGTSATTNALGQLGLTSHNSLSSTSSSSCLLGLNLQPADFLAGSGFFGRQFSGFGDHHHALASPGEKYASGGLSWPSRSRALDSTKASIGTLNNGVAGIKRPAGSNCSNTSSKSPSGANSNKKTSMKNSCPPFKVRKEKLGDRIAALHQLVSPFGKTDTASVLTEAIGYIQFLQDQIHTACMPNVKQLRNKPCNNRVMQKIPSEDHQQETLEGVQDLRKRGLCLVPLSWSSFITCDQMDASISLPPHHYF